MMIMIEKEKEKVYKDLSMFLVKRDQESIKKLIETYGIAYFHSFSRNDTKFLIHLLDYEMIEILKMVIGLGWNINEVDWNQENLLFYSHRLEKHEGLIDFLIQKGIDINHRGDTGFTPFLNAVESRNYDVAKKLYHYGANINAKNNEGDDVILFMKYRMNKEREKEWVALLLSDPERCEESLLKKLQSKRLELLF